MSHACACTCSAIIADDRLMCSEHWSMVPVWLQRDINRYYRAMNTGDVADRRLAIHNYRVARDAAIQHVDELLRPLIAG